jgi:ubiquinone/menaquinone biosynthesis C-methylase UbiE
MTPPSEDAANVGGRNYWQSAWSTVQGVETFSLHSNAIEQAKWHYLQQDLGAATSGFAVEVGCGSGHFGSLLAQAGYTAALLDYSPAAIACAMRSFTAYRGKERKQYLLGNALALPFSDNSVDVVASCGVLEHFERPLAAVGEMSRILKPGGLLYADICPDRFSLLRLVERRMPQKPGWFEIKLTKADIRRTIEAAGLRIKRLFSAGVLPPRSVPGTGRIAPMRLFQYFLINKCARFWSSLDGTWIADVLGSYYYVTAVKMSSDSKPV